MFNSKYNLKDSIMYKEFNETYESTDNHRVSSLTGPSFGLNIIVTLGLNNYMEGEITKQVSFFFMKWQKHEYRYYNFDKTIR